MEIVNSLETIKKIINESEDGSVFVASDFANIDSNEVVRKNLSLLTKRNSIIRIYHGLYAKLIYSQLTNEIMPISIDKVATAIARNNGWSIVAFGQTALNVLGLSNQVPVTYEYLSDGPYRSYEINGYYLRFLHRANKDISNLPDKTALIISAIKALSEANITNEHIGLLKVKLTFEEKEKVLNDTKYITRWVRLVLELVAKQT